MQRSVFDILTGVCIQWRPFCAFFYLLPKYLRVIFRIVVGVWNMHTIAIVGELNDIGTCASTVKCNILCINLV